MDLPRTAVGVANSGSQAMLEEGLRLVAVGMLTVFTFLGLLVGLMRASAAFFEAQAHRFPEADFQDVAAPRAGGRATTGGACSGAAEYPIAGAGHDSTREESASDGYPS